MAKSTIIAVCGKGGVGKTSISALIVKLLTQGKERKILAIDADPALGLATALGIVVKKTVDDVRKGLIERIQKGESSHPEEALRLLDYEMLEALESHDGYSVLALGRPEDEGCFCRVNSLLKDIMPTLPERLTSCSSTGRLG